VLKQQVQNKDHSVTYCWNTTVWVNLDKPVLPEAFVVTRWVKYAEYEVHIDKHDVRRKAHKKRLREVPGLLLFVLGHGDGVHMVWDSELFQQDADFPTIWCPSCVQRETCLGRHAAHTTASPDSNSGRTRKGCNGSRSNQLQICTDSAHKLIILEAPSLELLL